MELIGVIPAAGEARRLGSLPCSKEVLPLRVRKKDGPETGIEVMADGLLECYRHAGIRKVFFVLRKGKWDIPAFYGNGAPREMSFAYLLMQYSFGVPFSLREAMPFVQDNYVALGFPDILIRPVNCFARLHDKIRQEGLDVVLGLFPVIQPEKWDMVDLDELGNLRDIRIKEKSSSLGYAWSIAVWGPVFSRYLLEQTSGIIREGGNGIVELADGSGRELYPGDLFLRGSRDGLKIGSLAFDDGHCIDLGTPEDLQNYLPGS
jgi:glucose-1-phosphate thymidylyltransferase